MDPQFDQQIGLLDGFNLRNQQALENIGQVAHVELVVEVDSCLTERSNDVTMQLESALDDWSYQFLDGALELAEVLVEE